jgi:hypothetical protein
MPSPFIYVPILVLAFISLFSVAGLQTGQFGYYNAGLGSNSVYYDFYGNPMVYYNLTGVQGAGSVVSDSLVSSGAYWFNGSSSSLTIGSTILYSNIFLMFLDNSGSLAMACDFSKVSINGYNTSGSFGVTIGSAVGLLGALLAVMALSAIVGAKIFGSGEGEVSTAVILKFTAYLGLWGVFSGLTLSLLGELPLMLGYVLYFVLSLFVVIGLMDTIGGSSGGY